ncbi:MAG: DUF5615 family PIN-like protein [Candidatus Nanohalobium sp.]
MRFYLDEHVSGAVKRGLESRGHDVLTMQEADRSGAEDIEQLLFTKEEKRVTVTADQDFLRLDSSEEHRGIVFIANREESAGEKIRKITRIGDQINQDEMKNHVEFV